MGFRFEKLSILVVEDTMPMRKLLVSVLESMGIKRIDHASSGEKAIESFMRENHDIILTDWQMAPMDGLALTKEIRTNVLSPNRMVPIILITGYSAWSRVEEARDIGVTEFLVKPFTAKDLGRRIAHVINAPRDFVENPKFFGPNRRRKADAGYKGPLRRREDREGGKPAGDTDIIFK